MMFHIESAPARSGIFRVESVPRKICLNAWSMTVTGGGASNLDRCK